jgi:hypothetical protein
MQIYKNHLDARKMIDTGSGRINPNGNRNEEKTQWRLSETHLTEVDLEI